MGMRRREAARCVVGCSIARGKRRLLIIPGLAWLFGENGVSLRIGAMKKSLDLGDELLWGIRK